MEAITSAISQSYIGLVDYLLTSKNKPRSSSDALVFALRKGLQDIIRERKDGNDDPQVIAAIESTIKTIVKFLVARGANVNLIITESLPKSDSIFAHICRYASVEFVKMVMGLVDLSIGDTDDFLPIQIAMKSGRDEIIDLFLDLDGIEADDINRLDLLHHYVKSTVASKEIVAKFLRLGADLNCTNESEDSVARCAIEGGSLEIVQFLLDNGLDIDGDSADPPIWFAALKGREDRDC